MKNSNKKLKTLKLEYRYYSDLVDRQILLNEKIDKIIVWVIGFTVAIFGLIYSSFDKICIPKHSSLLFIFLGLTILLALISRTFSYLFSLSFSANVSLMKRKVLQNEKNYDKSLLSDYVDKIPLLNIKSKKTVREKIKTYKNVFVYSSLFTLVSFIISISLLIFDILNLYK